MEGSVKYIILMVILGLTVSVSAQLNPDEEVSQFSLRVPECPPQGEGDNATFFPHETDCTKYYECANQVPIEMDCAPGLHWNQELEVCDWPENAGCEALRVIVCPPQGEGDNATFFPHETDCTKYYECANQVPIEMECSPGLHWNQELEVCDWPENAGCEALRVIVCPPQGEGEDAIYFPHESDCTKYYVCANEVPVVIDCPDGLHWNKLLEICDWPEATGCPN